MPKYINKTQPTEISPVEYIKQHENQNVTADCLELLQIFERVTGKKPVLWDKVIGFGKYHYQQKASAGDWFVSGFAPRASTIAIYIMGKVDGMDSLGKYKMSGSCIHIKKLSDIDLKVLEELIIQGTKYMEAKYEILE